MAFQCPKCKRTISTRRRKICEFCGTLLPDGVGLNPTQERFLDRVRAEEEKRHKEFMSQKFPGDDNIDVPGSSLA